MSTISGHITLSKLVSKVIEVHGKSGMVKGIFIPILNNDLYYNDKTGQVKYYRVRLHAERRKGHPHSKTKHFKGQKKPDE